MTRTMKALHNPFVTNGYVFAKFIRKYSLLGTSTYRPPSRDCLERTISRTNKAFTVSTTVFSAFG